jgi:hypothetical protein
MGPDGKARRNGCLQPSGFQEIRVGSGICLSGEEREEIKAAIQFKKGIRSLTAAGHGICFGCARLQEDMTMRGINRGLGRALMGFILLGVMTACASVPELKVNYQLPPRSDQFKGKRVDLGFEDARSTKKIFGPGSREEFRGFTGNISFSVARYNEPGFKIGAFSLPDLFKEALKKRLENMGMDVLNEPAPGVPELWIALNEFELDLVSRKWVARMNFEAKLMKDGKILATQIISGQAERIKLIGRSGADVVLGEIFTDMVNRLDVARLFEQGNPYGSQ